MKLNNYYAAAAIAAAMTATSQAAIVFTDTFNYTVNNAFVAEGGWTSHTGTGGADAGAGFMWGNGNVLELQYAVALSEGDVITSDANLQRDFGGYFYSMKFELWDGADLAGTRTQVAFSDQEGSSATAGALTPLSYTVTAGDIAAGRDHLIFQYSHSANWGETTDVSLDITAVPEPSSTALLGLGGLALILRRRK